MDHDRYAMALTRTQQLRASKPDHARKAEMAREQFEEWTAHKAMIERVRGTPALPRCPAPGCTPSPPPRRAGPEVLGVRGPARGGGDGGGGAGGALARRGQGAEAGGLQPAE